MDHLGCLFHMFVWFPFKNTLWPHGTWNRNCFWLEKSSTYFYLNDRSEWPVFKKGFRVCQKYIGFMKTRDPLIHWIHPQLNPWVNNPWGPKILWNPAIGGWPGQTSDQMTNWPSPSWPGESFHHPINPSKIPWDRIPTDPSVVSY